MNAKVSIRTHDVLKKLSNIIKTHLRVIQLTTGQSNEIGGDSDILEEIVDAPILLHFRGRRIRFCGTHQHLEISWRKYLGMQHTNLC